MYDTKQKLAVFLFKSLSTLNKSIIEKLANGHAQITDSTHKIIFNGFLFTQFVRCCSHIVFLQQNGRIYIINEYKKSAYLKLIPWYTYMGKWVFEEANYPPFLSARILN